MSNLTFMFNNGNGTVLCNVCRIMLVPYANRDHQIDCAHICDKCFEKLKPAIYNIQKENDDGSS